MPEQLTALRPLALSDLVAAVDEMHSHEIRLFADLTLADLQDQLALTPPVRPVLSLSFGNERTADQCIAAALDQISCAVSRLWPLLWGGEDFSKLRDDALSVSHLPIRIADLATRLPQLRAGPAYQLALRLLRGRSPRLQAVPAEIEWEQLMLAFAPIGSTLVIQLTAGARTLAGIRALEWLSQHANARIAILSEGTIDADIFERVAYGARQVVPSSTEDSDEPILTDTRAQEETPLVLALPPAPEGQPHPMSPIEQKLYRLLQADDELRPLFRFNKTVQLPLLNARIDVVWIEGRVAIEIDGHEHRGAAKFRADRHRDYELVCAGYRVLRMTNDDVETDAALAIEKIRTVARLVRMEDR